jgi:hypothetical protein
MKQVSVEKTQYRFIGNEMIWRDIGNAPLIILQQWYREHEDGQHFPGQETAPFLKSIWCNDRFILSLVACKKICVLV